MIDSRSESGCKYPLVDGKEGQEGERRAVRKPHQEGTHSNARLRSVTLERGSKGSETPRDPIQSRRGAILTRLASQKAIASLLFAGSLVAAEPAKAPRIVSASEIFDIYCAVYYSTIVELPKGEDITQLGAGEEGKLWSIDWDGRYIFVKPKVDHPGRFTNVNAVTASGNVYHFKVWEVSAEKKTVFDLAVVVEPANADALNRIQHPQFVRADLAAREVDELKRALAQKTEELAQAKRDAPVKAMTSPDSEYAWKHGKESKALGLEKIKAYGGRTYIEAHSQHAPVLYEVPDEKHPAIVNYTLEKGLYVADHVIEVGELRAGKTKLRFKREKESS